jgi:hypothetical protein
MGRYTSDDNTVILKHESGTYAIASGNGYWIGLIEENSINDNESYSKYRYVGTGSRTAVTWEQGNNMVDGTLTYRVQDWRLPFWCIGSTFDTSGTNCTHTATEILTGGNQSPFTSGPLNPPISFTLEDAKKTYGTNDNFIRTVVGCIPNSCTINMNQGERITCELSYIGQSSNFSSGTATSVTALSGLSYQWGGVSITVAGSQLKTVKSATFEINNNIEPAFYLNGSRVTDVPIPGNKDYTLSITMDGYSADMRLLYNALYKGSNSFNTTINLSEDNTTTGSLHATFILSGCRVISADVPSTSEGVNEATFEIGAQNCSAQSWDRILKYNPW